MHNPQSALAGPTQESCPSKPDGWYALLLGLDWHREIADRTLRHVYKQNLHSGGLSTFCWIRTFLRSAAPFDKSDLVRRKTESARLRHVGNPLELTPNFAPLSPSPYYGDLKHWGDEWVCCFLFHLVKKQKPAENKSLRHCESRNALQNTLTKHYPL